MCNNAAANKRIRAAIAGALILAAVGGITFGKFKHVFQPDREATWAYGDVITAISQCPAARPAIDKAMADGRLTEREAHDLSITVDEIADHTRSEYLRQVALKALGKVQQVSVESCMNYGVNGRITIFDQPYFARYRRYEPVVRRVS